MMYDWNGNGKHDSFDDAMFMALLEDDLERHPPGKKTYRSSSSSSSEGSMGCMLYFAFLIFFPLYAAFEFLIMGEGGIAVGIIVLGVLLNIAAFCFMGSSTSASAENKTAKPEEKMTVVKSTEAKEENSSEYGPVIDYGNYKVQTIASKKLEIVGYTGIDEACLTVPKEFNGISVCSIGKNVFRNCMYIEQVIIPEGVQEIHEGAFCGCKKLKDVNLPSTLLKIEQEAFQGCALKSVTIPALVTKLGDRAFCDCKNLKQVIVDDKVKYIGEECFSGTSLQTFHFPKQLTTIGRRAFIRTYLTEVEIPGGVKEIGLSAFYGSSCLKKVVIADGVKQIEAEAFSNCEALREVTLPKSVSYIDDDSFAKKYYKNGNLYNLVVESQNIVMYCYEGSYGLEYARQRGFKYKNAEKANVSIPEDNAEPVSKLELKPEIKAAPKPEVKPESKPASTPARSTHSPSYTSGYIPVYTPSYTSSSISDDEPEETVRERLDYDLIGTGYDSYDLEWMDEDERNQVLEDNFLDPYDYDFDDLD